MKEHVGVLLWIYQQERPLNRLDYHAKLEIILKQNMKNTSSRSFYFIPTFLIYL